MRERVTQIGKGEVERAGQHIGDSQWGALVGHRHDIQPCQLVKNGNTHLRTGRPIPSVNFAGTLLDVGNQLLKVLGRKVGLDHEGRNAVGHPCDRGEILGRVVRNVFQQRHIGGQRGARSEQQGIAVWQRTHHFHGADRARCTGLVFDDERLSERGAQVLPHHARGHVGTRPCGERHDQTYRPARIVLSQSSYAGGRQNGNESERSGNDVEAATALIAIQFVPSNVPSNCKVPTHVPVI